MRNTAEGMRLTRRQAIGAAASSVLAVAGFPAEAAQPVLNPLSVSSLQHFNVSMPVGCLKSVVTLSYFDPDKSIVYMHTAKGFEGIVLTKCNRDNTVTVERDFGGMPVSFDFYLVSRRG